jgi:hypothetical protein
MDDVPWRPSEPEDVCSLCNREVTPKNAVLMVFKDGVKDLVCFECIEILERSGGEYPNDWQS